MSSCSILQEWVRKILLGQGDGGVLKIEGNLMDDDVDTDGAKRCDDHDDDSDKFCDESSFFGAKNLESVDRDRCRFLAVADR